MEIKNNTVIVSISKEELVAFIKSKTDTDLTDFSIDSVDDDGESGLEISYEQY